ncbi:hypothetical protein [Hydrocarboniphaga daqingensis]|nr:hypothetical protein [Hydrocarboniphaga daqingensis]
MDLMQTVDDTSKELVSNLSLEDAASADGNLADLDALLAQVETHYSAKGGADDAVKITQDARALLVQIHEHIGAGDFETANLKQSEFSRNCKACHKLYKKS